MSGRPAILSMPVPPEWLSAQEIADGFTSQSAVALEAPLRLWMWGRPFEEALVQARRAAQAARGAPDAADATGLIYLGEGVDAARDVMRVSAVDREVRARSAITEARRELVGPQPARAVAPLSRARALILPYYSVGGVLFPDDISAGFDAVLTEAAAVAASGKLASDLPARTLREIALWRHLAERRAEATGLVDVYDALPDDDGEVDWYDVPAFELLIAIDALRGAGLPVDTAALRSLPPSIAARGGWWV